MDTMTIVFIIWGVMLSVWITRRFIYNREQKEALATQEDLRKKEFKAVIQNREYRENTKCYDENEFWMLIDDTKKRSKGNYKNQMGLLRDKLSKFSTDELIEIDNLLIALNRKAFTWDLYAASNIIYKDQSIDYLFLLISWIISRGEFIFNNSLVNPNIIINQDMIDMRPMTISDLISELYTIKTQKLIPEPEIPDFILIGDKWDSRELPNRYGELWQKYA
jgi:hypothetical protein